MNLEKQVVVQFLLVLAQSKLFELLEELICDLPVLKTQELENKLNYKIKQIFVFLNVNEAYENEHHLFTLLFY